MNRIKNEEGNTKLSDRQGSGARKGMEANKGVKQDGDLLHPWNFN